MLLEVGGLLAGRGVLQRAHRIQHILYRLRIITMAFNFSDFSTGRPHSVAPVDVDAVHVEPVVGPAREGGRGGGVRIMTGGRPVEQVMLQGTYLQSGVYKRIISCNIRDTMYLVCAGLLKSTVD